MLNSTEEKLPKKQDFSSPIFLEGVFSGRIKIHAEVQRINCLGIIEIMNSKSNTVQKTDREKNKRKVDIENMKIRKSERKFEWNGVSD